MYAECAAAIQTHNDTIADCFEVIQDVSKLPGHAP